MIKEQSIIIILLGLGLLILFWNVLDLNINIQKSIKECNDHWQRQVMDTCPGILRQNTYNFIPVNNSPDLSYQEVLEYDKLINQTK